MSRQTQGNIKDLLQASDVDSQTDLVLTSAIYFKANWRRQFEATSTKEGDFFTDAKNKVQADMMDRSATFRYAELENAKLLEMPYVGDTSMVVVLPAKRDGLVQVEKDLCAAPAEGKPAAMEAWIDKLQEATVHVVMPKFKFSTRYDLVPTLKQLGMKQAFDSSNADFSAMMDKKTWLSLAVHQAMVAVNETGTEAAAATAVEWAHGGIAPAEEDAKPFVMDHPFLFVIRHADSGTILFVGRVSDPTK